MTKLVWSFCFFFFLMIKAKEYFKQKKANKAPRSTQKVYNEHLKMPPKEKGGGATRNNAPLKLSPTNQQKASLVILPQACILQTGMPTCWKAASVEQGFPSHSAKHTTSLGVSGQHQKLFHHLRDLSQPAKENSTIKEVMARHLRIDFRLSICSIWILRMYKGKKKKILKIAWARNSFLSSFIIFLPFPSIFLRTKRILTVLISTNISMWMNINRYQQ